jgi:hypothetical protein
MEKIIFSEEYKSLRYIILNFLHPSVDISTLCSNIFLIILFSTISLLSLINVYDWVHTHIKQEHKQNPGALISGFRLVLIFMGCR